MGLLSRRFVRLWLPTAVSMVLATLHIVGVGHPLWAMAISIPLSIVVGWLFMHWVEMPSHHVSKRVGRQTASLAQHAMGRA